MSWDLGLVGFELKVFVFMSLCVFPPSQRLREAILKTRKNPKVQVNQETQMVRIFYKDYKD